MSSTLTNSLRVVPYRAKPRILPDDMVMLNTQYYNNIGGSTVTSGYHVVEEARYNVLDDYLLAPVISSTYVGAPGPMGPQGPQGAKGDRGDKGLDGSAGMSAFDVWRLNYSGGEYAPTMEGYLKYMEGKAGTGMPGRSAFDVWNDEIMAGTGTMEGFMAYLKGGKGDSAFEEWKRFYGNDKSTLSDFFDFFKGDDGKSAFDIWNETQGYGTSTPEDMVLYMKGIPGKSAFQEWLEQPGNEGLNEDDFFNSLVGKSAFQDWREAYGGSESTVEDFVEFLKGTDGKTAFEIWKEELGNEDSSLFDFLEYMHGQTGESAFEFFAKHWTGAGEATEDDFYAYMHGIDGESAYDVWLREYAGGTGTPDDYIKYMSGKTGKDAYEIWVAANQDAEDTSYEAWVEALRGPQGIQGKSVLEVWQSIPGNEEKSFDEWAETLKGKDGDSAYQQWLNEGNSGSPSDFIVSLTGPVGPEGPMGNEGPPGEDGNNALIVSTSYDILEPGKLPFLKQEFPSTSTTNLHFGLPAGTPGKDGKSLYDIWVERTPELEQHDYDIFFAEFKGSDGERGAEGPMGPHTNIRVGTTEYSTEAQPAAITERPDLENDVIYLDFVMPTGKEGPMGPPGPRGLTGSLGEDLSDVPQNAKLHMRMWTLPPSGIPDGNSHADWYEYLLQSSYSDNLGQTTASQKYAVAYNLWYGDHVILNGLEDELGRLSSYVNKIASLGHVLGSVATKNLLPSSQAAALLLWDIDTITENDFAIVETDSSYSNATTRYEAAISNTGTITWVYAGKFSSAVPEIPTALPNPNALTVTKYSDDFKVDTVTYNGKSALTLNIYGIVGLMFPVSANLGVNTEWVNINNRYTNSFYYFKGIHLKDSDGNTIAQYNPVFGFGYHELSITPDSYYQTITIPTGAQGNFVTLDTDQIIRSNKVFTEFTTLEKDILIDLAPTIDPSDKSGTFVIDCNDVRPLAIATDTAGNCNLFNFNRHPTCPDRTTLPTSSSPSNEYATARQVYKAMTVVTVSATEPTDKKAGDIWIVP